MSPLTEPTRLTLQKTYVGVDDPDAAAYITLVEAADTAAGSPGGLETATKVAIHSFVKGCKADGIWPAIKASCILAGARTIDGALVPLAGATGPSKFGTAANWNYDRKTGLQGDGTTNYLDSNRNNNADPQNNKHAAVYRTQSETRDATRCALGAGAGAPGVTQLVTTTELRFFRVNSSPAASSADATAIAGLYAASRNSSSGTIGRYAGVSTFYSDTSAVPIADNLYVFRRLGDYSNARIAFYSIGESLDLALLDARVTDLITAIGVAF